jgi:hypothetical protein
MEKLKLMAIVLLIGIIAVSCKKETGPAGPAGTNGNDGNANVTMYVYGTQSFTSVNGYIASFTPTGLTASMIETSMMLSYYKPGANYPWYTVGGLGANLAYQTRMLMYTDPISIDIRLNNPDGTAYTGIDQTWDSVRIFVVPASVIKIAGKQNIDLKDYASAKNYLSNY